MNGQQPDSGVAGRSARREYERRRQRRLQSTSHRSRPARLIAALFGPSAKEKRELAVEKRWATGAQGEAILAELLAKRCPDVPVLHDRRMPHSRAPWYVSYPAGVLARWLTSRCWTDDVPKLTTAREAVHKHLRQQHQQSSGTEPFAAAALDRLVDTATGLHPGERPTVECVRPLPRRRVRPAVCSSPPRTRVRRRFR